ncbi:MAG TPA: metal ABC transporter permease [Gemmataceae bacterium]|nr:metal ABC transporter permease [Gemmataceae bacterium]
MGIFLEPFVRNAFLASTLAAVCAGVIGYFVVLRRLSFASHALAHVGFTGAAGAVLLGVDVVFGTLLFTVATGVGMGVLGDKLRGRDTAIGTTLAFTMGLGLLFLYLSTKMASMATNILFGDVLAVSDRAVLLSLVFAIISLATMAVIYRPLLFASVDPEVAAVRGVPVRLLGLVFMVLLAWTVAQAVQVVGVLLIFALMVTPAAAAQHLTARPALGMAWSVALAVISVWAGLALGFLPPYYPPSFYITAISFLLYIAARGLVPGVGSARRRSVRAIQPSGAAEVRVMQTVEAPHL